MTNKISSLLRIILLSISFYSLSSCAKDDFDANHQLVDPSLSEQKINTGFTNQEVPIKADNWAITYVKDGITGEPLNNKAGEPFKLSEAGMMELESGWLKMEKTADNKLIVSLLENFSDHPRKFIVGLVSDNKQDEITYIQSRGESYEIVKKDIQEVEGSRKVYSSTEGCSTVTVKNDTDLEKSFNITAIFKGVKYSSEFTSEDYGAFDWVGAADSLISMDQLIVDGSVRWNGQVVYKKGTTLEDFVKESSKEEIKVAPNSTVQVSGEMEYLERTCEYTFTIKNSSSGHQFPVKGTWKQKVPLSPHTILN